MSSRRCEGSGQPAVEGAPEPGLIDPYPHCPACGRDFESSSAAARRRGGNPWESVPVHYVSLVIA